MENANKKHNSRYESTIPARAQFPIEFTNLLMDCSIQRFKQIIQFV